MKKASVRRTAKAGELTSAKAFRKLNGLTRGFLSLGGRNAATIQPKSAATNGQWVCADCGEVLQNNMMADGHAASLRLAWWTGEHLEEP